MSLLPSENKGVTMKRSEQWLITLALTSWLPIGAVAVAAGSPASSPVAPSAASLAIDPEEKLGTVSFAVSCAAAVRAPFNRGIALLHDFWYDEAKRQFTRVAAQDPACAMAHWGIAMSSYYQIWDRPDADVLTKGWVQMRKASALHAGTARERAYIAAASGFFRPGDQSYQSRVDAYSASMAEIHRRFPDDVDAGAFYALSLLAAEKPDDTSLAAEHKALDVLNPLFAKYPDHPGVVHYIIHACDTPSLAPEGLTAARHYGEIASSGAHAVHMPGHIFSRLGLWQEDIQNNLASVAAVQVAEKRHESDGMDQFHSDDFLIYAFLQSGQEARAKHLVEETAVLMTHYESMPQMTSEFMRAQFPYYRGKFPAFYALETRDWRSAANLQPVPTKEPETQFVTYWARAVAHGHLHQAEQARADLAAYQSLLEQVKQGKHAYVAEGVGTKIRRGEMGGWAAFAEGRESDALASMREAADLQDKVGQGEVDIPAREMLADMLLESHRPDQALVEYQRALALSPNRFNGLFNAGMAAEAMGDRSKAESYYSALLKATDNGSQSARVEFEHVRNFVAAARVASD
jgi:tetratricopeptide (TPR) repeat protein